MKASAVAIVCGVGLLLLASAASFLAASASSTGDTKTNLRPRWVEVKWPFAVDQWGSGKAYTCRAADCGADLTLYLRAKIGFCNCRGVETNEELERVSDLDLISDRYATSGPGRPISVGAMQGRSRPFAVSNSSGSGGNALAIAFHDRCDLVVATAVFRPGRASDVESVVLRFLNTAPVLHWVQATLGL
jgi:hypothetical protein